MLSWYIDDENTLSEGVEASQLADVHKRGLGHHQLLILPLESHLCQKLDNTLDLAGHANDYHTTIIRPATGETFAKDPLSDNAAPERTSLTVHDRAGTTTGPESEDTRHQEAQATQYYHHREDNDQHT